ncbi:MAG: hypothetical protein ACRDP6_31415, partial [Actinoallomurus sp.]
AGLLVVTYVFGGVQGKDVLRAVRRERSGPPEPHETVRDVPDAGTTRQDLPVRGPTVTRQDIPVRPPDATRQDLPVRRRPDPEPPQDR